MAARKTSSVNTKRDVEAFRAAAERYTRRATVSKKTARETLISLGIITKSGKLTARYTK